MSIRTLEVTPTVCHLTQKLTGLLRPKLWTPDITPITSSPYVPHVQRVDGKKQV